jgi:flagellar hook assembly protein FlgD
VTADQLLHIGGTPDPTDVASLGPTDVVGRIYPQPSKGVQFLSVTVARAGPLRVRVYDVRGSLVREIFHGDVSSAARRLEWDGRDGAGQPAAPGVYFWRGEGALRFERRAVRTR